MGESEYILVFSSAGSQLEADSIGRSLVEKKLAACVSILPGVTSHYHWEGARRSAYEVMLVIKALRRNFDKVRAEIECLHSFELPEVLMVPVEDGSPAYLQWIQSVSE